MLCIVMFMPVIVCMQFEEKMITGVRFGTMIRRIILTLLLLELLILVLVWTSHHNKHRHNNSKYYHSNNNSNKVRMIVGTARYRRTEGWVWRICVMSRQIQQQQQQQTQTPQIIADGGSRLDSSRHKKKSLTDLVKCIFLISLDTCCSRYVWTLQIVRGRTTTDPCPCFVPITDGRHQIGCHTARRLAPTKFNTFLWKHCCF